MAARERGAALARVALAGACAVLISAAPLAGQWARTPRPFEHRRHERVSCLSCHGTGSNHRVNLVRSARDCAGCHHADTQAVACRSCHKPEDIGPRAIGVTMSFASALRVRDRQLLFRHELHLLPPPARTVACRDCHATPVSLRPNRTCNSCHADHHRPQADCTSCHVKAPRGTHGDRVHLGCSATGCHAPDVAPLPTQSRTTCLACHMDRKDHEPQGTCATCHRIPAAGTP